MTPEAPNIRSGSGGFRLSGPDSYPEGVPTVYVRGDRAPFHKTVDCTHGGHQLVGVDLEDLVRPTPCRWCYPDFPKAQSVHLRCRRCNHTRVRPCEHNGGVPVIRTVKQNRTDILVGEGHDFERVDYVWPEDLRRHLVLSS